jgi:hypothetical protein
VLPGRWPRRHLTTISASLRDVLEAGEGQPRAEQGRGVAPVVLGAPTPLRAKRGARPDVRDITRRLLVQTPSGLSGRAAFSLPPMPLPPASWVGVEITYLSIHQRGRGGWQGCAPCRPSGRSVLTAAPRAAFRRGMVFAEVDRAEPEGRARPYRCRGRLLDRGKPCDDEDLELPGDKRDDGRPRCV